MEDVSATPEDGQGAGLALGAATATHDSWDDPAGNAGAASLAWAHAVMSEADDGIAGPPIVSDAPRETHDQAALCSDPMLADGATAELVERSEEAPLPEACMADTSGTALQARPNAASRSDVAAAAPEAETDPRDAPHLVRRSRLGRIQVLSESACDDVAAPGDQAAVCAPVFSHRAPPAPVATAETLHRG